MGGILKRADVRKKTPARQLVIVAAATRPALDKKIRLVQHNKDQFVAVQLVQTQYKSDPPVWDVDHLHKTGLTDEGKVLADAQQWSLETGVRLESTTVVKP